MIDLTPLDVRKKRGDFRQKLRGYDPEEVDTFLELVEDRLEALVKENLALREKVEYLQSRLTALEGREQAVQDALVSAQALRKEVQDQTAREVETLKAQAKRETELHRREAENALEARFREAQEVMKERQRALEELERNRQKFLKAFRSLLERELDAVEVEEARRPLEDVPLDIQLRGWERREGEDAAVPEPEDGEAEAGSEFDATAPEDDAYSGETDTPAESPSEDPALFQDGSEDPDQVPFPEGDESVVTDESREESVPSVEEGLFGEDSSREAQGNRDKEREEGARDPLWLSALLDREAAEEEGDDQDPGEGVPEGETGDEDEEVEDDPGEEPRTGW